MENCVRPLHQPALGPASRPVPLSPPLHGEETLRDPGIRTEFFQIALSGHSSLGRRLDDLLDWYEGRP